MAITKVPFENEYGKGELTESHVTLTLPGAPTDAKPICRFVHITDLHATDSRPGDDTETAELAKKNAAFWANIADFCVLTPDGSKKRLIPAETNNTIAERIRELAPDAVFFTGDTVDFPSVSNFLAVKEYMDSLGAKCFMAAGNHDDLEGSTDEELVKSFELAVGTVKDFAVDSVQGIDIVCIHDGFTKVTAEQVEKLRAQLDLGRPTVVLLHAPVMTESVKAPAENTWGEELEKWVVGAEGQDENCMEFVRLLNEKRNTVLAVFAGHIHTASGGGDGAEKGEGFSPDEVLQFTAAPAFTGFLRVIDILG